MSLTPTIIEEVWSRAIKVNGFDGSTWRIDAYGSPILHDDYGNRESRYGWVVGRVRALGSPREDKVTDLRAIQWQNVWPARRSPRPRRESAALAG